MDLWKPFAEEFDSENFLVFKTDYWSVLVRKNQVTLGSLVLAANRNFISASDLQNAELEEFPKVVGRLEEMLSITFGFDKINYLCLMMADRHYHFHVIPRYETPKEFFGRTWVDNDWPKPPSLAVPQNDMDTLISIRDMLKNT